MSALAWRRRPTRHFGDVWVPFAELSIRSSDGGWRAFSLQIDTGAVISVLRRSAADVLGIDLVTGDPVELGSVGGYSQRYFIHRIQARVGDLSPIQMRAAFAEQENVPNLLGRLDVLDQVQLDLDISLEESRFSAPWLDERGRRLWRHFIEVEAAIIEKWSEHALPGRLDEAARRFLNRADQLVGAAAGLLKLDRSYELPLVIRALFELSVQFEYLMADPGPRAELYLDYEHVTKYRSERAWLKLPGLVGDRLRNSEQRPGGAAHNLAAYERVCARYAAKSGTSVRSHWYPGSLRDLATEFARLAEYGAFYGLFSAWAHGDPWTSKLLELGHGGLWHALAYWARLLVQIADAKKIILTGAAYETLVKLSKGLSDG